MSTSQLSKIEQTRIAASDILPTVLSESSGKSELNIRNEITTEVAKHEEIFPEGWYAPPPMGVSVLCDEAPFTRLQYETLRDEQYFPSADQYLREGSVTVLYMSPVDRSTGLIGDIGLSLYPGSNSEIQDHIKTCHDLLIDAASMANVDMRFSELYSKIMDLFAVNGKKIGWMTTWHDPLGVNLGHTVPGSYGESPLRETFEDTKEAIRSSRLYINQTETFAIPPTCAFTVEARLTDLEEKMPNVLFHTIVVFENGERKILTNFDNIFQAVGMHYIV